MSERMSNAPVYYALAQAHFNPVAAIAKYVDDIQDQLRRAGYTLFTPHQMTHLQFDASGGRSFDPQVTHTTSWFFTKGDQTSGFILNASSLTFHTTHYKTSDEFIPDFLAGLKVIDEVLNLDHVARLGLRYLDAVLPSADEMVNQYLIGGLHGVEFDAEPRYSLAESIFESKSGPLVSKGNLVCRVHKMFGSLGYPPDMFPNDLVTMDKFVMANPGWHAVIDTDHFVEGMMPVDFMKIRTQLINLHSVVKDMFGKTITDHALSVWA